ncbi:hypothetical protein R3P38DRAFT_3238453 [Favolaschia claudopus]|uniref:Protein argonaute N-terminal domain-containing protein n=1 Tax=Favolaschia claudopus TaxID=2862362 RepID=A0AAV9Z9I3_9AGAR
MSSWLAWLRSVAVITPDSDEDFWQPRFDSGRDLFFLLEALSIRGALPVRRIDEPSTHECMNDDRSCTTVGVRRPDFSNGGTPVTIQVNSFATSIPNSIIHHYDVVISPSEKTLPARMTMDLIRRLQFDIAPQTFTPRGVYDGRKNLFCIQKLPFSTGSQQLDVTLSDGSPSASGKGPKVYKIKIARVAEINPEVLHRFIQGKV